MDCQTNLPETPRRGRKTNVKKIDNEKITIPLHHFNYSETFVEKLENFAKAHLEDKNKEFRSAWKVWTESNADEIQSEISKITEAGYSGSVEDKMYFSARYYYRKKAIKDKTDLANLVQEEKSQRKKYDSVDSELLGKMSDHIISQFASDNSESHIADGEVRIINITPGKSYAEYCKKYSVSFEDEKTKKIYKNLYWRITSKRNSKTK